ncbi:MAG: arsenate reductase family protein [Bdellovibrionales bacterium]
MTSTSSYQLFGIPNCDTVKKVRVLLEKKKIDYEFIDFKKRPPTESDIQRWKSFMKVWPVNTKGPTYRKIREKFEAVSDNQKMKLLIENSSAIKRPILEKNGAVQAVGLDLSYYK